MLLRLIAQTRRGAAAVALCGTAGTVLAHALTNPGCCDPHTPADPDATLPQAGGSWRLNLGRTSGFWGDARWYDAQIDRKLHVVAQMIDELVFALPPLGANSRVADLCSGSGRAALSLLRAYPEAHVSLVDMDARRTSIAVGLARQMGLAGHVRVVEVLVDADGPDSAVIPGAPDRGYGAISGISR